MIGIFCVALYYKIAVLSIAYDWIIQFSGIVNNDCYFMDEEYK